MKTLISITLTSISLFLQAQGIVNNGNKIVVKAGAFITVNGTNGNITNTTLVNDGSIDNEGSISLQGNWLNSAPNGGLINTNTTGTVTLNGTSLQSIGGSSATNFENLTLVNASGAQLSYNQTLKGTLTVTSGILTTTGYNFTLLSDASGTARIAPILGNINGNITMQRYLSSATTGWRSLGAPVTGRTLTDWEDNFIMSGFSGSSYPSFPFISVYSYNEAAAGSYSIGNVPATDISNPITPGTGYWCYVGPTPITVDVTGPPVKFAQTFSVSYTPSTGTVDDGYVMIGNPYPSSIDWTSASWTKTNINNAVYVWNPQLQQYSSWVAGVGTNGGSNIIPSSQGFFIQANAAGPALSCNENIKSTTDQAVYRLASQSAGYYMNLKLFGNGYGDEAYIRFDAGATHYYDADADARKYLSDNPQVPSLSSADSSGKDMSINSFPLLTSEMSIPVKTTVGATGSYTITGDTMNHMPPGFCIILEDLLTGAMTDLRTTSSYVFNIEDTTATARFLLHMGKPIEVAAIATNCYQSNTGKAIAKGNGSGPWDYVWYNSSNAVIKTSNNSMVADTVANLAAGIYSVSITDMASACGVITSTVEVNDAPQIMAAFVFLHDTIFAGSIDSLQIINGSSGTTNYSWNFGDGSPVENSQNPKAHSYTLPGTYTVSLRAGQNNCFAYLSKMLTVVQSSHVAIEETKDLSSRTALIYPNPNDGHFSITLPSHLAEGTILEIYNTSGKLLYKEALSAEHSEVDLSYYAKAIYFYKLVFPLTKETQNGKLIIY
jgi:hypothetical protein